AFLAGPQRDLAVWHCPHAGRRLAGSRADLPDAPVPAFRRVHAPRAPGPPVLAAAHHVRAPHPRLALPEDPPRPGSGPEPHAAARVPAGPLHGRWGGRLVVTRVWLLVFGVVATVSFATIVLVGVPSVVLQQVFVPEALSPYSETELRGRQVYIANGCVYCHSQQLRDPTFTTDVLRGWGDRASYPSDYVYD